VAHQRWESGQLAVEPDDRLSFCRKYALWVVRGVGRDVFNLLICLLLDAVAVRDLTTVQTLVMLLVAFALVVNALTDVAYRFIDPRITAGDK